MPSLEDHPDQAFYEAQEIGDGFGYIEMRDGTLLSATVRLPGPIEDGPYPTVIEYSGYDPASPYDIEPAINIYGLLGWATVGVNMRGSGCSGGAYDYMAGTHMIGGFAVVAYPVRYGESGVTSFMVSHDAVVYQKDLGPDSEALAKEMAAFDPNDSWTRAPQ